MSIQIKTFYIVCKNLINKLVKSKSKKLINVSLQKSIKLFFLHELLFLFTHIATMQFFLMHKFTTNLSKKKHQHTKTISQNLFIYY